MKRYDPVRTTIWLAALALAAYAAVHMLNVRANLELRFAKEQLEASQRMHDFAYKYILPNTAPPPTRVGSPSFGTVTNEQWNGKQTPLEKLVIKYRAEQEVRRAKVVRP